MEYKADFPLYFCDSPVLGENKADFPLYFHDPPVLEKIKRGFHSKSSYHPLSTKLALVFRLKQPPSPLQNSDPQRAKFRRIRRFLGTQKKTPIPPTSLLPPPSSTTAMDRVMFSAPPNCSHALVTAILSPHGLGSNFPTS